VPHDAQDLRTFHRGNTIHKEWQDILAKDLDVDAEGKPLLEYRLEDEHSVGRLDFVTHHVLVDIKTQAERAFKFTRSENRPKPTHVIQVGRYARKLVTKGIPLDEARILYVSRGDFTDAVEFGVSLDEAMAVAKADQAQEEAAWTQYQAGQGLPAELAPDAADGWLCKFCAFANYCSPAKQQLSKYTKNGAKDAA